MSTCVPHHRNAELLGDNVQRKVVHKHNEEVSDNKRRKQPK